MLTRTLTHTCNEKGLNVDFKQAQFKAMAQREECATHIYKAIIYTRFQSQQELQQQQQKYTVGKEISTNNDDTSRPHTSKK